MDKMNTLCNNSRHLTYLVESFCNNSRISELIGSISRSRLFCFSQVRFAGIEMGQAEPESVNSWRRIYWYQNFPFLDSYFMHRASESWIRKAGIFIARTSCFLTKHFRDFLICRPKVYSFNTHCLWKYIYKSWYFIRSDPTKVKVGHQGIFPQEKNLVKLFCRQAWPMVSGD